MNGETVSVPRAEWEAMKRNIAAWKEEELDWIGERERAAIKLKETQRWAYQMRDDLRAALLAGRGWKRKLSLRMLRLRIENDRLRWRQEDLWRWHDEAQSEKMHSMRVEQQCRELEERLAEAEARSGSDGGGSET